MKTPLNRRQFLKRSALAAGGLSAVNLLPAQTNSIAPASSGQKIRCVQIGCGVRSQEHLDWIVNKVKENLVAIVEVDEKRQAFVKKWLTSVGQNADKVQVFTDYRQMYDKIGKEIDAVFVATPNHHHAPASILAMERDIAVYCEKPVCHNVAEARRMRALAVKSKAPTQMGNQGHCQDGYRGLCEYIWSGAIGKVTETHSWTDRANGGVGPRPPVLPVPAGMNWDQWIGPAPYRDFHSDIHPHEWHGWYDFGNGSIGNMGCHVLDGVFWALKLEHPTSIEAEEIRGGSKERYPMGSRIRWDFPARGDMAPVKVYWYEGLNKDTRDEAAGNLHAARGNARNLPPILLELKKQYPDEDIDGEDSGTLYVGDKGIIYTGTYGGKMHIVPREKMAQVPKPPMVLSRPKNGFTNFLDAVREGRRNTEASFDYGTRLTEFTLLANLAQYAGAGKKLDWDGQNMRVTNMPELEPMLNYNYRDGWKI